MGKNLFISSNLFFSLILISNVLVISGAKIYDIYVCRLYFYISIFLSLISLFVLYGLNHRLNHKYNFCRYNNIFSTYLSLNPKIRISILFPYTFQTWHTHTHTHTIWFIMELNAMRHSNSYPHFIAIRNISKLDYICEINGSCLRPVL